MRSLNILRDFLIFVIRAKIDNLIINVTQNRNDLKKWLLAIGDYGRELQKDLNAVVGYDEKFNNAIVRHALDCKNASVMQIPNPLNVTFRDVKKFDMQNPIMGKIATQIKESRLTEDQLTKKILMHVQISDTENRLAKLKRSIKMPSDSDDDEGRSAGEGGKGSDDGDHVIPPIPGGPSRYRLRHTSPNSLPYTDSYLALMERYNKLKGSNYYPPRPLRTTPRELVDIGLARISESDWKI